MVVVSIPSMSCIHCKATVENTLKSMVDKLEIDLPARVVRVEGGDSAAIIRALDEAGYAAAIQN